MKQVSNSTMTNISFGFCHAQRLQQIINLFIRPSLVRRCLSWRRTSRARSSSTTGQHPLTLQSLLRRRGTRNTSRSRWRVVCQTSSITSASSTWKVETCKPCIPSASDQADGAAKSSKTMFLCSQPKKTEASFQETENHKHKMCLEGIFKHKSW